MWISVHIKIPSKQYLLYRYANYSLLVPDLNGACYFTYDYPVAFF